MPNAILVNNSCDKKKLFNRTQLHPKHKHWRNTCLGFLCWSFWKITDTNFFSIFKTSRIWIEIKLSFFLIYIFFLCYNIYIWYFRSLFQQWNEKIIYLFLNILSINFLTLIFDGLPSIQNMYFSYISQYKEKLRIQFTSSFWRFP